MSIPQILKIHDESQAVAKAFKNAHLQYSQLRNLQHEAYDQTSAITLAVAPQWDTQKGLLDSL